MKQRVKKNWSPIPYLNTNTGLVSVSFPPLLTSVWVGIVVLFKWAAIGEHLDNFSWGEVPNCVIKYLIHLEYD